MPYSDPRLTRRRRLYGKFTCVLKRTLLLLFEKQPLDMIATARDRGTLGKGAPREARVLAVRRRRRELGADTVQQRAKGGGAPKLPGAKRTRGLAAPAPVDV